ncbi:MAG: hypothetical protein DM484_17055 [Candidatus Methylumidiphilus alinenensis]|uniref:Uncharacterized protein n=1 Tax=Candidatus Methylumidiphilus alinenensis TaxID=2202197 RepID=A0A2W4QZ58_9GAMM|nr:MAG: hypothetical protein DM484_17055 [Candidatus Methylumidiphilus alinenensis]
MISNNESTKTEMNCPRKSPTIPPQITLPSWSLAFLLGAPSPSLAFGWDVLYWISPYRYRSRACLARQALQSRITFNRTQENPPYDKIPASGIASALDRRRSAWLSGRMLGR